MDTLDDLLAAEAIRLLKARYFRAMDTKQWDLLDAVFTSDATCDYRGALADPDAAEDASDADLIAGRDAIIAYIRSGLSTLVSAHQGFMPEIQISGPDTASAIWAMTDVLKLHDSPIGEIRGYGHYHETYRKEGGQWRIATLKLTRLRVDHVPR